MDDWATAKKSIDSVFPDLCTFIQRKLARWRLKVLADDITVILRAAPRYLTIVMKLHLPKRPIMLSLEILLQPMRASPFSALQVLATAFMDCLVM